MLFLKYLIFNVQRSNILYVELRELNGKFIFAQLIFLEIRNNFSINYYI